VHYHQLLSSESVVAHSSSLLAAVWLVDISAVQLRCRFRSDYRTAMVPSAEGLLLCNSGPRLRDYRSARAPGDSTTHSIPDAATHTAAHATGHSTRDSASDSASHTTHSATRTCRSLQLRCGSILWLGPRQADMVLPASSYLRSADGSTASSRSLQLPGWLRELAGRLERG